jgi:nitrate/nitrite transport system ATP-binding protein
MAKPYVYVENIARRHRARGGARDLVVFENLGFGVERGEFVTLIGHSGCGKSTILNILAGLDSPSEGYVYVAGKVVTGPGLSRGVIFQNHSLLPWLSALGNVMFSVRARNPDWARARVREHSLDYLRKVGLEAAADRRPAQLSGGMRQRVGIARAFAIEPAIMLMDEPFGALDALTRASIQDQLLEICAQTGQTVIMITHDVDEALYLSDRILVMSDGPNARIAETVAVDLGRPRERAALLRSPRYHALRAHLLDFLTHATPRDREASMDAARADADTAERTPASAVRMEREAS